MKFMKNLSLITLFLIIGCTPPSTSEVSGRVVGISDGDTITVLAQGDHQIKVRLADIDCPEKSQPWGNNAKSRLSELIFSETVDLRVNSTDRYDRKIADVFFNDGSINYLMVKEGHCWPYFKYNPPSFIIEAYETAKAEGIGLWGLNPHEISPPWDYRKK